MPYLIAVAALATAIGAIVSTYSVFDQTWDESAHLAVGIELLDTGRYEYEEKTPPLARIAVAVGPYLYGVRHLGEPDKWEEGRRLLYESGDYDTILTLARLGTLPFLILAAVVVFMWAERLGGRWAGTAAVLFLATTPPILAQAGIAATDVAAAATVLLALYGFERWLEAPTRAHTALVGIACGLAVMTKYSAPLFLGASFVAIVIARWVVSRGGWTPLELVARERLRSMALALLLFIVVLWAVHGFAIGPFAEPGSWDYEQMEDHFGKEGFGAFVLAAIELPIYPAFIRSMVIGFFQAWMHTQFGHPAIFFGETRTHGWELYFPVALAVKTPLPLLLLGLAGFAHGLWSAWRTGDWRRAVPALSAMAILAGAMQSTITIGVRHVMPVHLMLAIAAGVAVVAALTHPRWRRAALVAITPLALWQLAVPVAAHPDYIAYFNPLAGSRPERIMVNSDLDWGQDLKRLRTALAERKIEFLHLAVSGSEDPARHGFPPFELLEPDYAPVTGWVAVSLNTFYLYHDKLSWLDKYEPVARIGKTIDLYFIPPKGATRDERPADD